MEQEKPLAHFNLTHDRASRRLRREFGRLYYWWKKCYLQREDLKYLGTKLPYGLTEPMIEKENQVWHKWCTDKWDQDEEWLLEEQEMLTRLIRIRKNLWT